MFEKLLESELKKVEDEKKSQNVKNDDFKKPEGLKKS
jgi:hypothetical protein